MYPYFPKHSNIRFTITSDIGRFSDWAYAYWVKFIHSWNVYEDGSIFTWDFPTKINRSGAGGHTAEYVVYGQIRSSAEEPIDHDQNWAVIRIELIETAPDRLQIYILCDYEDMFWFVRNTLEGIVEAWPETRETLNDWILELSGGKDMGAEGSEIGDKEDWKLRIKQPWLRDAVEMWRNGSTSTEIGLVHHISPRTVTNRISELRAILGVGVIPYHKKK